MTLEEGIGPFPKHVLPPGPPALRIGVQAALAQLGHVADTFALPADPPLAPQPVQQEAAPVPPAVVVVDRAADVPDLVPRGQDLFALDDSGGGGTATAGS